MPDLRLQLLLARHADTAWAQAIRPWLEESHTGLQRSYVVVPTRGQAQGLKQRCVAENVPLLGVEFLSPGLARQKWLPLSGSKAVLGRELLLFELRWLIARRMETAPADAPERGLLLSLQSDAERALDDFDELLKAGFGPEDFEHETLRSVFSELSAKTVELGYSISSVQSREAATKMVGRDGDRLGGRLLVYGLSAEAWGEFFNVAAFVRRFDDTTVILPEPEFRGKRMLDENWVELWQSLLGTPALPLDGEEPARTCEAVAAWWGSDGGAAPAPAPARVAVGRTRTGEMALVADEVVRLLAGAKPDERPNIGVIFPGAGPAHDRLAVLLQQRGVPFVDLLPRTGAPSTETQLSRALVDFYAHGARLDELLALWPLLRAVDQAKIGLGEARRVVENLFEERQTHALTAYLDVLAAQDGAGYREVYRLAQFLLPAWPEKLTLAAALDAVERRCETLLVALPPTWAALREFSRRETESIPLEEICDLLLSFLPEKAPAGGAAGGFAPVTLTTRRRAEGLAWTHLLLVESNAGVWPFRSPASGWLTDEHRARLNLRSRFTLGLFLSDDRASLEKRGYAALARDTREEVFFSAALADEKDPEAVLAPNSWLERVLWRTSGEGADLQSAFEKGARDPGARRISDAELRRWAAVWAGRRDPGRGFDEYFLSVDPAHLRPAKLSARAIEAGIQDPATWWFEAVLGVRRIEPGALLRAGGRVLGSQAHRVLSAALRGENPEGEFFPKPDRDEVEKRLAAELVRVRALWPADCYWDSFHAVLVRACEALLDNLFAVETPGLLATEVRLPERLQLALAKGCEIEVAGRMDLVCADRVGWAGSTVDIVDFKTGKDVLSARQMAAKGAALQLGLYLAAVRKLGASRGRVWMVKPEAGEPASVDLSELDGALVLLERLAWALQTGRYGALTADRSDYAAGKLEWPLACAPIPETVLAQKYAATFGVAQTDTEDAHD